MSTTEGAARDDVVVDAGASADQHITGAPETETFTTDEAPKGGTPAGGSSNAGINHRKANRADRADFTPDAYDQQTNEESRP